MRRRALAALVCFVAGACNTPGGPEELKLSHRSRDAGPAVVIVDRVTERAGQVPVEEKEPNDAKSGGQALALPGAVRGKIDGPDDWDVYKVTIPAAGTLRATLSAVDDADLILEAQGPGGELLAVSDDGPAKTAEVIPNLFVHPGTVSLVVHEYRKPPASKKPKSTKKGQPAAPPPEPGGRTQPSGPYFLEVTLGPEPAPGEEHEPNNDTAFADDLALGQTGRGYVGWKKDVDVWKLALDGVRDDEALSIDVDAVAGVALKVAVLDAAGATLLERRGASGAPLALRSVQIREKNSFYFIVVSGDRPNPDEPYTLRAAVGAVAVDEEAEPNDSAASANPLADVPGSASGQRLGTLPAGDVDVYKVDPVADARTLALTLEPPATVEVELAVLAEDGHALAGPVGGGKKGAPARLPAVALPAGAPAYVRVSAKAGSADSERYHLRWTVAAGAPAAPGPAPVPGVDE
jgi:hypothetical protein